MRIIAKSSLRRFWEFAGKTDAQGLLESWHETVLKATWRTPQELKAQFTNASSCGHNRVVFNIGGNKYRLVVEVQYAKQTVWVKFVGTPAECDAIDVERVNVD